jgi:hypothetical protein
MIPRCACRGIGSKTVDDGVKNVDVATHGSKRSVAFDQNGGRRGRFSVDRAILPITGVLLGRRYHHRHHAINSWRGLDRLEAAFCGHRARRRDGGAADRLCGAKRGGVWCRRICARTDLRTALHRTKRVSVRGDYASHRHARSACRACMDDRRPSVPRNFRGNRSRIAPDRRLAGA